MSENESATVTVYRDKIAGFCGSWGSGIASLHFESGRSVMCDNGPTVRALRAAFGEDVIGAGHTLNQSAISGQDIIWQYDEMGLLLGGFAPVDVWPYTLPDLGGELTLIINESGEVVPQEVNEG